jgi:hypothetical protein
VYLITVSRARRNPSSIEGNAIGQLLVVSTKYF